jgi:uncharacterized 2Fe-2S/4Fe-4S cluster protein (DUF4445 family)
MVRDALGGSEAREILIVGNTVMHHLFCGIDVEPLAQAPFHTLSLGERRFTAAELDWNLAGKAHIAFLPCMGSFVGSDIAAGIVAIGMTESDTPCALMDLGTNGEIVVGCREDIACASTAAGPAFEAGRIRMGMRAVAGAIDHVTVRRGLLQCHVIGGSTARGICGSGLVDAIAAGLDTGAITPRGRLANGSTFPLCGDVRLSQRDVRELQLAKGAVAAGYQILADNRNVTRQYLAGAFGNYVDAAGARRIGLLSAEPDRIVAAGNTALRGARLLLLNRTRREELVARLLRLARHVPLGDDPEFAQLFAECLNFPEPHLTGCGKLNT